MQEQGVNEDEEVAKKEKKLFKLIASRRGKLGVLTQKKQRDKRFNRSRRHGR